MQTVTPEKNFGFYTYDEFCYIQSKIENNQSLVIPETITGDWDYNERAIHLLCILKALNKEKPFVKDEYKELLQHLEERSCKNALVTAFMLTISFELCLWLAPMPCLLFASSDALNNILPIGLGVFALTFVICSALSFKYQTNLKSEAELCTLRFFSEKGIKLEKPEPVSNETQSKTKGFLKKREAEAGVELTVMRSPSQIQ